MDESSTDGSEYNRKVGREKKVAGAIRSLVYAKDLQLEHARVLHKTLLVPIHMYGSETMLWKEKDNLRGLVGIRKMNKILNAQVRELCRVRKDPDERID